MATKNKIPAPIIATLANFLPGVATHAEIDNLFFYADAPGEPPEGSKPAKTQSWLRLINKESDQPLKVLGKLVESYIEVDVKETELNCSTGEEYATPTFVFQTNFTSLLAKYGLQYHKGGVITEGGSVPSKSLSEIIKGRDIPTLDSEFDRALVNLNSSPKEAVSAACNILETLFKVYIEDEGLSMPQKLDIQSVWKVVRNDLGLDPKLVEDNDLKKILSGIFSIVDGVGALRSHASSAHGHGRVKYKLKPRHARLAVNSAHTLSLFILETWDEKKSTGKIVP